MECSRLSQNKMKLIIVDTSREDHSDLIPSDESNCIQLEILILRKINFKYDGYRYMVIF